MTTPVSADRRESLLAQDWLNAVQFYLGRRAVLLAVALAIGVGVAFNWHWLVAAGIAPILLTALPCVVMCVFGLCSHRLFGNSCSTEQARPTATRIPKICPHGPPTSVPVPSHRTTRLLQT